MNKEQRKQKISQITKDNVFASKPGTGKKILYRGQVKEFRIVEVPLEYLILNVENGRIASLVKSFEREHSSLDPEKENDSKIISQFLYDSHEKANDRTRADLAKNGQLEAGIITSDGTIVDGNRRYSLMLSIAVDPKSTPDEKAKCQVFRTIVLPEDADEKEILRLETSYQMGADEKVGYNAIEKYLHARDMYEQGFSIQEIAEYMGLDKPSNVETLLEVMTLIDDYLDYCDCKGIYTRLPKGFEDDLLKLNTACKKIRQGGVGWIPEGEQDSVENDLKSLSYDFIRLNMKSEDDFDFRAIASTANSNFLLNENVWKQFVDEWSEAINDIEEEDIDTLLNRSTSMKDTQNLLDIRDEEWRKKVKDNLKEAFTNAQNTIDNKKEKDKPGILIKKAVGALREVNLEILNTVERKDPIRDNISEIEKLVEKIKAILG